MSQLAPAGASASERALGILIDEVTAKLQAGEPVDVEAYARKHPEYAEALRRLLPALDLLADLGRSGSLGPEAGAAVFLPTDSITGTLGDFRILREVGRGGMGVVYEAEQISLGRRVALKVLPFAAALDPKQLQRFRNEAQAAAHLHHQHIVPVHAVGCERGVPFYAMQFIDGQTVAALIRELRQLAGLEGAVTPSAAGLAGVLAPPSAAATNTPPVAALSTQGSARSPDFCRTAARLGLQAAEALEYAHSEGIIHRDIKPANLLVEWRAGGINPLSLWITDFGLARVRGEAGLTLTGDLLGTLRYMSPEQALGQRQRVDHRTDVYSLGATLYEFLTLEPVHDGCERLQLLHQISSEPPRPIRRLNPAVPADLETIVLKALDKEPEGRYATAQELADDLRRFLEDKPIRATRPTLLQRGRKWARRHPSVVVAGLVVLLMAFVAWAVSTVLILRQRDEARVERARAQEQREFARQVVDKMYTEVAEEWLAQQAHLQEVQRRFLLEALHYYEAFAQEPGTDPELRLRAGIAYRRVGAIQFRLGEPAQAKAAYARAVDIQAELAAAFPARPEFRRELAESQNSRALLLMYYGRLQEAELALGQSVALQEGLAAESAPSPDDEHQLAVTRNNLALLYRRMNRPQEAKGSWAEAMAVQQRLVAGFPDVTRYRLGLANTCKNLADLLYFAGDYDKAKTTVLRAVELQEQLAKDSPGMIDHRLHLAQSYHILVNVLRDTDQYKDAEVALRRAVPLFEQLAHELPGMPQVQEGLARTHRHLGYLLWETNRPDEAKEPFRRARTLYEWLVEKNPDAPLLAYYLAWFLADCPDPCCADAPRAIRLAERAVARPSPEPFWWNVLGMARYRAGEWQAALEPLNKSVAFQTDDRSCDQFYLAMAHWKLGHQHLARDLYHQACAEMKSTKVGKVKLRRLCAEAAALLGVAAPADP